MGLEDKMSRRSEVACVVFPAGTLVTRSFKANLQEMILAFIKLQYGLYGHGLLML